MDPNPFLAIYGSKGFHPVGNGKIDNYASNNDPVSFYISGVLRNPKVLAPDRDGIVAKTVNYLVRDDIYSDMADFDERNPTNLNLIFSEETEGDFYHCTFIKEDFYDATPA